MPMHSSLSALVATALPLPLASAAIDSCYFPNGSLALDYNWKPCYSTSVLSDTVHSPCCIPDEGDICQDDGLCYYAPNNHVFRGACTDPTFADPACPQQCTSGGGFNTWVWVQKCLGAADDGDYACGGLENDGHQWATCATPDPSWSLQTQSTSLSQPTRTASTTTTAKPTTTTAKPTTTTAKLTDATVTEGPTATATTTTTAVGRTDTGTAAAATGTDTAAAAVVVGDAKPALGTGAIVGIVVGGVAVIAIAAAGIWFCLRSKRKAAAGVAGAASQQGQPGEFAPGVVPAGGFYAGEKVGGPPNAVEIGGNATAYADQTYKAYPPTTSPQPTVSELHSPGFVQQQYAAGAAPNELPSPGFVPGHGQQFAAELDGSGVRR